MTEQYEVPIVKSTKEEPADEFGSESKEEDDLLQKSNNNVGNNVLFSWYIFRQDLAN